MGLKMNKIKIAKQKRLASGLEWRFRAVKLLSGGLGKGKYWYELTKAERAKWFMAFIKGRVEYQLEQQND